MLPSLKLIASVPCMCMSFVPCACSALSVLLSWEKYLDGDTEAADHEDVGKTTRERRNGMTTRMMMFMMLMVITMVRS